MKKLLHIVMFLSCILTRAQDVQFTQFNNTQVYLNPSLTGLTGEHRINAAYRNQWPGIKKTFTGYFVSYDYNLDDKNSGFGGYVLYDQAGSSNLSNTQAMFSYSYRMRINSTFDLRSGLQVGFHQRKYELSKLVFTDQLITGAAISQDALTAEPINFFDAGAGLILYSKTMWFGIVAKHLTQPNISLTGGNQTLPLFLGAHGAYIYEIAKGESPDEEASQSISFLFNFRHQNINDQIDLGVKYFHKFISAAVWYRGIPFKKYSAAFPNNESIALIVGYEPFGKEYKVAYSFDYTISKLGFGNTFGSHELTLGYEFGKKGRVMRKARPTISTPMKF